MIDMNSHPNHWAGSMSVYSQKEGQMLNVGAWLGNDTCNPVCRSVYLAPLDTVLVLTRSFCIFVRRHFDQVAGLPRWIMGSGDRSAN